MPLKVLLLCLPYMSVLFSKTIASLLASHVPIPATEIEAALEIPPNASMGDVAFPCFKLASVLKKGPPQIAQEIAEKIKPAKEIIRVGANGPYVNFFYDPKSLALQVMEEVAQSDFGVKKFKTPRSIMIEYVSPNTNKPLHLGHALQGCLGTALCRISESQGYTVVKSCLVNDRGAHICKSMLAYAAFGNKETPQSVGKKGDFFCGDYYVLFTKKAAENPALEDQVLSMLQSWEKGDPEVRALWKKMRQWCLDGFFESFKRFGFQFDVFYYESEIYQFGKDLVQEGEKKGVFKQREDGSIWVDLKPYQLSEKTLMRKDGTSIYITQDLYLAKKKFADYQLDESLVITASEQNMHFAQLYKILELLGFEKHAGLKHLGTGMVHLPEGRMKSREGTVVDADNLLTELESTAMDELESRYPDLPKKELEKRKTAIAKAALYFFLLRSDAKKDIIFDAKKSVSFDGETGPYLLYAYARAKSILRKGKIGNKVNPELLVHEKEQSLLKLLSRYPAAVEESWKNVSPHTLCQYLLSLSSEFNSFYQDVSVLNAENDELKRARMALVADYAQVLSKGLELLGIKTLEEM